MRKYLVFFALALVFSCNPTNCQEQVEEMSKPNLTAHHIPEISAVLEAQGGFDEWMDLKKLSYEMGGSETLVELSVYIFILPSKRIPLSF